jgi:hypothetical protein
MAPRRERGGGVSANFRRDFWAVASLIKILLAEWIAVLCLAQLWGTLMQGLGRGPCPGDWSGLDAFSALGLAVGAAAFAWWLWRTLWPTALAEEFKGQVKLGFLVFQHGRFGTSRYRFLSSHPAYLLVDAVTLLGAWFLFRLADLDLASDGCVYLVDLARGEAALGIALLFPVIRLAGWYLLRRRVQAPLGAALYPALWFLVVLSLPAVAVAFAWWQLVWAPRAAAPLLDRRPAEDAPPAVVRLVGALRADSLQLCPCPAGYDAACRRASLVVDLADRTVVLVVAESLGRRDLEALAKEPPEPFETYGRLVPREPALCGFAQARPDLVLRYELP